MDTSRKTTNPFLPVREKGTKPNPQGEKSRNIERLSSRNVRFCWIVSTRERREAAIRFEKGTETVTVHPVTCAVMPICCHGRFLRFPSSLPPLFLLHSPPILSIYPRARYTRGTMDKLDKRYEEREEEKEEERERGGWRLRMGWARCEQRGQQTWERMLLWGSSKMFLSLSLPLLFFFHPVPRLLFFPRLSFLSSFPAFIFSCRTILESAPRNAINTKKIRTNYHQFFTVPRLNISLCNHIWNHVCEFGIRFYLKYKSIHLLGI